MKESECILEAGHTIPLADILRSCGNPPVRLLTNDDLKKEYEFFQKQFQSDKNNRRINMLGDIIRKIRIKSCMSQSELARKSGHAVSTIHNIESGYVKCPGFKAIGDIAHVLGIPLEDLYQVCCRSEASPAGSESHVRKEES